MICQKRAQTTLYVMLSVLVLIMVGFYLALSYSHKLQENQQQQLENQLDISAMKEFATQCLHDVALEGIAKNAMQAGYYRMPEYYLLTPFGQVPFYYYWEHSFYPPRQVLEQELAFYLSDNLDYCIRKFRPFRQQGYQVITGKMQPEVFIKEKSVDVVLHYPVEFSKDNMTSQINEFRASVAVPYGLMHKIAGNITQDVLDDPYFVHHSQNMKYMQETGLQIDSISFQASTVYVIRDNTTKTPVTNQLMFLFAVEPIIENQKPHILLKEDVFEAHVGEPFLLVVPAKDPEEDLIEFSDDTTLFDIGKYSGIIEFTPTEEDIGNYFITITASDGFAEDKKEISMRVIG